MLKSIAFFSYDDQDAMATLRLLGPAKMAGWEILRGYDFNDRKVHLEVVDQADLVFMQRDFCRDYDTYTKVQSLLKTQGKPFIFDLDDNLFVIPADHPSRMNGYYTDALLPIFQAVMDADLITVTTELLREYLSPFNPNVRVIPNYLDDTLWNMLPRSDQSDDSGTITIGFVGGDTHRPDVRMVVPVLLQLLEKYPGRIEYHFWGTDAPKELEDIALVDWYPVYFINYAEFVTAFQLVKADILIAPLCDNLFNACKSVIKFLEYGAVGIPGVYSHVTPYVQVIDDGKDGFLASSLDEWLMKMSNLIESPGLRAQMVSNAREKIRQDWLLSTNIDARIKIYADLLSNFRPKKTITTPFYNLTKALAEQYSEQASRKDKQIELLQGRNAQQHEMISQLEEELLSYLTSRSWQLTRPFREFSRLFKILRHV